MHIDMEGIDPNQEQYIEMEGAEEPNGEEEEDQEDDQPGEDQQ